MLHGGLTTTTGGPARRGGALPDCGHFIGRSQLRVAVVRARSAAVDEFDSIISQPNDAYFKQVFSHLPRATLFFQTHLDPALVAQIDWPSLQLEPTSFVKQSLQQSHSDLLFSAQMGGRELKLYLLFEHQTSVDVEMPLRLLSYVLEILLAQHKATGLPLPPVLPFVLHQGPDRWTTSTCFEDMFALPESLASVLLPYLPKFQHLLLDLTQSDPDKDEIHDSLRLVFQLMKMARQKQLADFLSWMAREMSQPGWDVEEALVLLSYLYAMCVDPGIDEQQIAHSLEQQPNLNENMMSLAQKLIARGQALGEAVGEARGQVIGEARGVWIGKIQLLEQMTGMEVTTTAALEGLGLEQLAERYAVLEQGYAAKFKQG